VVVTALTLESLHPSLFQLLRLARIVLSQRNETERNIDMNINASTMNWAQDYYSTLEASGMEVPTQGPSQDDAIELLEVAQPDGTIEDHLEPGEPNRFGGDHDLTAW
jgi:hypothetical protein